jgi:hypothetical protein
MEDVLSVTFFLKVAKIKPVRAPTLCCAMTAMGILQGILFEYRCRLPRGGSLSMDRDPKSGRELLTVRAPKSRSITATGILQPTYYLIVIIILAGICFVKETLPCRIPVFDPSQSFKISGRLLFHLCSTLIAMQLYRGAPSFP